MKSGAAWIASADVAIRDKFIKDLTTGELLALPFLFEFWAMDHQLPPKGDWRSWVILGGRGCGKTRAGSEWVRSIVEGAKPLDKGQARRVALVAETYDQARNVMIFGDSGIMACSPPDRCPTWKASERKLIWPNGAEAQVFSAHDPEGLRGPQFDAAWVDELAKWKKAQDTWDMLQFALRLGDHPQVCVTTTPRNVTVLKQVLSAPSTVQSHATTVANRANLAASFLEEMEARYAGTSLGRQELEGVLVTDVDGAMWNSTMLSRAQVTHVPELDRVVVALDPSVSRSNNADACGIVVVGAELKGPAKDWRAYVLADCTLQGAGPTEWAKTAIEAMDAFDADRLVAEVNQGGQLVEEVVRQVDPLVCFKAVHASRGKSARAEPVASLYEQGRVRHVAGLVELEAQMCLMTPQGYEGQGSPDRVDALVWAVHDLIIAPAATQRRPQIRAL